MFGELLPCAGGAPIPLHKSKLLVGRQPGCDVPLRFSTVSSRHCELSLVDGYWVVRDLGSRNGIRVNGEKCDAERLMPNDVLWVANHRFEVVYQPEGGTPAQEGRKSQTAAPKQTGRGARPKPHPPAAVGRLRALPRIALGELLPCGGGDPIPLLKPKLLVGRRSHCDITLRFPTVSSRHCELELRDDYWFVRDLGSRNGIRIDGVRCEAKWLLPQAVLWISNHRYEVMYSPPDDAPLPAEEHPFARSLLEKAGLEKHIDPDRPPDWLPKDSEEPRRKWTLDDD